MLTAGAGGAVVSLTGSLLGSMSALGAPALVSRDAHRSSLVVPLSRDGHVSRGALSRGALSRASWPADGVGLGVGGVVDGVGRVSGVLSSRRAVAAGRA